MASNTFTTDESGVTYVANIYGYGGFSTSDVTAEKLYKLRGNLHGRSPIDKLVNEVFPEEPTIEAVDRDENPATDLERELRAMLFAEDVDVPTRMRQTFIDRCWFGASILNWVWAVEGNRVVLKALTWLQPWSFGTLPSGCSTVWSPILQGIVKGADKKTIEFHQMQDGARLPTKLDERSILMVLDPTDGELAGDPLLRPVVPHLEMLSFCYNATMQLVNRWAVPPLFIKIMKPQPASPLNGNVGDVDYANMVLKHWGKDNAYPIRDNMELITFDGKEGSINVVDIIKLLIKVVEDYTNPSNQLAKSGTLIGGSSEPEADLTRTYIRGHHRWIEAGYNRIIRYYLDANGYTEKGYTARFRIPERASDRSRIQLEQAREMREAKNIMPNEHRMLCGATDALSDSDLAEANAYWTANAPAATPFTFTNAAPADAFAHHDRIAGQTYRNLDDALKRLERDVVAALEASA